MCHSPRITNVFVLSQPITNPKLIQTSNKSDRKSVHVFVGIPLSYITNKPVRFLTQSVVSLFDNTQSIFPLPLREISEANCNVFGYRQRAWNSSTPVAKNQNLDESGTVFVTVRRNYKVIANNGLSRWSMRRLTTILNTRSGPSFIKNNVLHDSLWKHVTYPRFRQDPCQ